MMLTAGIDDDVGKSPDSGLPVGTDGGIAANPIPTFAGAPGAFQASA